MRCNIAKIPAVFLIMLVFAGCEDFPRNNPEAVFIYRHVNYAWGIQDYGFIIDAEGNIREFNLPATWNYPDEDGYISESEMEENFAQLGETTCTVNRYDASYFAVRLREAQSGKITAAEHRMCDFGADSYAGFLYEPENHRYKYVFIRQTGDWYSENTSRDAGVIYEWLKEPCKGSLSVRF